MEHRLLFFALETPLDNSAEKSAQAPTENKDAEHLEPGAHAMRLQNEADQMTAALESGMKIFINNEKDLETSQAKNLHEAVINGIETACSKENPVNYLGIGKIDFRSAMGGIPHYLTYRNEAERHIQISLPDELFHPGTRVIIEEPHRGGIPVVLTERLIPQARVKYVNGQTEISMKRLAEILTPEEQAKLQDILNWVPTCRVSVYDLNTQREKTMTLAQALKFIQTFDSPSLTSEHAQLRDQIKSQIAVEINKKIQRDIEGKVVVGEPSFSGEELSIDIAPTPKTLCTMRIGWDGKVEKGFTVWSDK